MRMSRENCSQLRGFSAVRKLAGKQPLARTTMHATRWVTRIRDMIIEETLPPGNRIHEGQPGAALGISRTPLREALKFLASEGPDRAGAGARGRRVASRRAHDVRDMLNVLAALEVLPGASPRAGERGGNRRNPRAA